VSPVLDDDRVELACFEVRGQQYGIDVQHIREIVRAQTVTPLPRGAGPDRGRDRPARRHRAGVDAGRALGTSRAPRAAGADRDPRGGRAGVRPAGGRRRGRGRGGRRRRRRAAALVAHAGYDAVRAVVRRADGLPTLVLSLEHLLERVYRSAILLGVFSTLLRLTAEQWWWFGLSSVLYAVIATPLTIQSQRRIAGPVMAWLDRGEGAGAAFTAVIDLPAKVGTQAAFSWFVPVMLVSVGLSVRFESWGWRETAVMLVGGVAAGFVVGVLHGFAMKSRVAPVREALAAALPDPQERARLIHYVPLRAKLLITLSFATLVPVIFAVMLAQQQSDTAIDSFAIDWQQRVLEELPDGAGAAALEPLAARLASVPAPVDLAITTLSALEAKQGLEPEVLVALHASLDAGERSGSSRRLPSDRTFAWRQLADGEVAVAWVEGAALRRHGQALLVFALLVVLSSAVVLAIAYHTAHDISHATELLRGEAERLSQGDLRPGRVWESEDELGSLARSFASMAESLRRTLSRVAEAADRVDGTAGELLPVSEGVAGVTELQVRMMDQASSSMGGIDGQVRGIARSSSALNESVEEASSSILEMGASGEELNETAVRLHESVEGVSTSIEQLVRSVKQVLVNTESLSSAAEETSASMEEMASSLREVDVSAEETSRLSAQVVERAETGQAKVRETIEGMEAIQAATETAEQVIRGLHGRTVEIGAIVDVIDDVADETNLLALNAAIIAAQAGEHGRAFSVVADEIKDLAERVLASTKEIGGLIAAVQEEASAATSAIEKGTASVASGVERSAEAGMALEAITKASRRSGQRMEGIVLAVQAQAKAAGHVVELMERVRGGVEQIRRATQEQDQGHAVVSKGSVVMRDVAQQVRGTTEEQARGSGRIRESIEGVRIAAEQINEALQEQSQACAMVLEALGAVQERTRENGQAARTLDGVTRSLRTHAETLREEVGRFQLA
jgi:methyl-accepting chemotaxis protein